MGAADDLGMDFLDALAGLVDKSLVRPLEASSGEARFGMLETIREYGLEQLQACGEAAEVQRQHAEYFAKLVAESNKHATGPQQGVWLDRLEAELGNLRAVLAWSKADAGRIELGLRLADDLYFLWSRRGPIGEGKSLAGRVPCPTGVITLSGGACGSARCGRHFGDQTRGLRGSARSAGGERRVVPEPRGSVWPRLAHCGLWEI